MVIYKCPQLCWEFKLEWLTYFKHAFQFISNKYFLVSILGATPNHTPLKYRCPINTTNRIRHVCRMGSLLYLVHGLIQVPCRTPNSICPMNLLQTWSRLQRIPLWLFQPDQVILVLWEELERWSSNVDSLLIETHRLVEIISQRIPLSLC